MRALILTHLERETPGRVVALAEQRGIAVEIRQVDLGAPVPKHLDDDQMLIVMGGPMGVADIGDIRYPFLAKEVDLLHHALERRMPILGICLGAQLLAHATGAAVYRNMRLGMDGDPRPAPEVGFGKVRFLNVEREPVLIGLRQEETVLHWHGDTFDLPREATRLASSDLCLNQAFRIGDYAFGLQFHVEVDAQMARCWALEDAAFVDAARGPGAVASIRAEAQDAAARMQGPGDRLLGNILSQLCHTTLSQTE
jgi:GMP synthase (glutamine-hydrolysing)